MLRKTAVTCLLLLSANVFAVNWTANIGEFITYKDGRAKIRLVNFRNSSSGSTSLGCDYDWVSLGNGEVPNPLLFANALNAYDDKRVIRLGVESSGATCYVSYLTSQ